MREPYRRPISSTTWWLSKRTYVLFMLRELTSVLIAAFLVVYLIQLAQLAQGAEAYTAFVERLASPGWLIFHLLVLIAALYHSITWFNLTPQVIIVRRGEERVPHRDRELVVGELRGLQVRAALQGDDPEACSRKLLDHHAAARAGPDHTDVELVALRHAGLPRSAAYHPGCRLSVAQIAVVRAIIPGWTG